MDLTDPLTAVAPSVHTRLLVYLWHQGGPQSGRALARALEPHATRPTVQEALRHLEAAGVVVATNRPPAVLYELNRDHVAAKAVGELADLRGALWARIVAEIEGWSSKPIGGYLFGSAARGEATAESDIDLLLVYADAGDGSQAEPDQARLAQGLTAWSGNRSQVIDMTMSQLAAADRDGQPLIAELQRDAVALHGPRLQTLLRQAHQESPSSP